jgi:hypothetical protein
MILTASPESRYFRVGQGGTRTDLPLHDGIFPDSAPQGAGLELLPQTVATALKRFQNRYCFFVRSAQTYGSMEAVLPQVFRHGWKSCFDTCLHTRRTMAA